MSEKSSDTGRKQHDELDPDSAAARLDREASATGTERAKEEPELQLWSGGYSPKAMIGEWLLVALASIALVVVSLLAAGVTLPIALGLILLLWAIAGLRYAYRRLSVHYELTNQRFLHQTGILSRQTDRIEVIDIDDVSYTQGLVQRLFGVGRIVLTSSDRTHPKLTMIGIADVQRVASLIDDTRRKERRRRSLHIEAI